MKIKEGKKNWREAAYPPLTASMGTLGSCGGRVQIAGLHGSCILIGFAFAGGAGEAGEQSGGQPSGKGVGPELAPPCQYLRSPATEANMVARKRFQGGDEEERGWDTQRRGNGTGKRGDGERHCIHVVVSSKRKDECFTPIVISVKCPRNIHIMHIPKANLGLHFEHKFYYDIKYRTWQARNTQKRKCHDIQSYFNQSNFVLFPKSNQFLDVCNLQNLII